MLRDYDGTDLQVTHEFQFNTNGNVEQIVESLRVRVHVSFNVLCIVECYEGSTDIPFGLV